MLIISNFQTESYENQTIIALLFAWGLPAIGSVGLGHPILVGRLPNPIFEKSAEMLRILET